MLARILYFFLAINICKEGSSGMDVMVDANRKMQLEKLLRDRDIEFEVATEGPRNKSPINILGPRPKSPSKQP